MTDKYQILENNFGKQHALLHFSLNSGSLGDDKVIMLAHAHPHKTVRKINP